MYDMLCPNCGHEEDVIGEMIDETYLGRNLTATWNCVCHRCGTRFVREEHYRHCFDVLRDVRYKGDVK